MDRPLRQSGGLLWRYLKPQWGKVLLLLALLLGSITLQLIAPQFVRTFLDAAQAGGAARELLPLAGFFFVAVLSQKIITLLSIYVGEDVGWSATNRLRGDLARHVLRLDMGFHKLRTPGELIERIDGDVSTLAEYFSSLVVQVLGNGLLVAGIVVLQFREGWPFGAVGLAYALATLLFLRLAQPISVRLWARIRQGYAEMSGFVEERLNGTEDIRANGGEAYVLYRLYPLMARVNDLRVRAALWGGATFSTGHLLYVLAWIGTLGLAGAAYLRGELSIGTVFLLAFYIGLLESPLKYIRRQIENMQRALASIGRIAAFFDIQPQVQEHVTAGLPATAPTVHFADVSFAYKDRPSAQAIDAAADAKPANVLQEIDFSLPAGRVLGVLGRTGSGKTTLTRLLFRLYDVDAGAITLDGIDIRHAALSDLRRCVGMVTQDVELFAASVRDNLTLFRNYDPHSPPISDAAIEAALAELGLDDWLRSLPHGLDTELATGGQGLSAGEAQLLALARVFLRDPQVVILDEASSRLDPATERRLERAIERLLAGRTAIVIAHRLATVARADDVLILEDGRIREQGPRAALAADPTSRLAQILRTGLAEALA